MIDEVIQVGYLHQNVLSAAISGAGVLRFSAQNVFQKKAFGVILTSWFLSGMELFKNIYFNYISFDSIIATTFLFVAGLSLMRIQNKSKATIHLALIFLWEVIHNFAYVIAFGYYDPIAAYHRWLSVGGVLPGLIHMNQFFFYFPEERRPRTARAFLLAQYGIAGIVTGLFVYKSLDVGKVFHYDGEFWDVDEHTLGAKIAILILLYLLIVIGNGLWCVVVDTKGRRKKIAGMLAAFLVVAFVPAILNFLSKTGRISKEFFHTAFTLILVLGFFVTVILYINITKDRTSFMYKIIGVSSVTLLIIMLVIGYFTLSDMGLAYDDVHRQRVLRILNDAEYRPPDLMYVVAHPKGASRPRYVMRKTDVSLDFSAKRPADSSFLVRDSKRIIHYKSYTEYDSADDTLYEVGFSYRNYREYIQKSTMRLIVIVVCMLVVVLAGFRVFLYGTLISPLKTLINGLRKVERGDLDVQIAIHVEDEIGFLTGRFNSMVETIKDYTQNLEQKVERRTGELEEALKEVRNKNVELAATRDELWGEMQLARKIQTILLPYNPVIKGYEIAAHMEPAQEVGGDYYDVINTRNADWVIIGDVSGHGVPAGLIMMMVQTSIQTILRSSPAVNPIRLLKAIDKAIKYNVRKLDENKYMTITAFSFKENGVIEYAGLHQDVLVYRARIDSVEIFETNGPWLGIDANLHRLEEDFSFTIGAGDVMLLYSDGITEARNGEDRMYGSERLSEVLRLSGRKSSEEIKKDILDSMDGYENNDDVTIVIIKRI